MSGSAWCPLRSSRMMSIDPWYLIRIGTPLDRAYSLTMGSRPLFSEPLQTTIAGAPLPEVTASRPVGADGWPPHPNPMKTARLQSAATNNTLLIVHLSLIERKNLNRGCPRGPLTSKLSNQVYLDPPFSTAREEPWSSQPQCRPLSRLTPAVWGRTELVTPP